MAGGLSWSSRGMGLGMMLLWFLSPSSHGNLMEEHWGKAPPAHWEEYLAASNTPPKHPDIAAKDFSAHDYRSLIVRARAEYLYGTLIHLYGRPACTVASWFTCLKEGSESSDKAFVYFNASIQHIRAAQTLRGPAWESSLILWKALTVVEDFSAALDVYEQQFLPPESLATEDQLLSLLNFFHVATSRNCYWGPMVRGQSLLHSLVKETNVAAPAMHFVEIPNITAKESLVNMRRITRVLNKTLEEDLRVFKKPSFSKLHKGFTGRIVVGYVSGKGFQDYTTTRAMLGVFIARDRQRFHVVCYAGLGDDSSEYRKLTKENCDKFVEAGQLTPKQLAEQVKSDGVHILIDLHGYTLGSSTVWAGVFPFKAAPLQMHFHGQPQTTGNKMIDYYITDKVTTPADYRKHYQERLVVLPDYYLCNSLSAMHAEHWTSPNKLSRKSFGFSKNDVLLAYFGQPYKIEPEVFGTWMRILKRAPKAKLWLFRFPIQAWGGYYIDRQVHAEAAKWGINSSRIVFSDLFPKDQELASKQVADLFLDTTVFNSHTTGNDALFAGLPVLTLPSELHIARVGSSLVAASGMPKLIARNLQDYEDLAVALARRPKKLREFKEKYGAAMAQNRGGGTFSPLWDLQSFVRGYNAAVAAVYDVAAATGGGKRHFVLNSNYRSYVFSLFFPQKGKR